MSELQKFSKGYLEKFHEPRLISGYSGKVCTDACFMMLEEIPSEDYRVTIKGYNEVLNLDDIENENDFYVDYTNNYIYFHKSKMGQTITVDDYYGIGLNFIGASRIIVRSNVTEDVIQTLEDLIEQAKLCLEAITTLGGATEVIEQLKKDTETGRKVDKQLQDTIKSGEATVQAIKDTGNKSFIVNKTDWTSTTNGYKYTLTHNLQSIDLHVSMIDLTDNMAYPSQYKIINVNKIEVYAMEQIKANIVISAKYYNGLGENVGDKIVQEVADARVGMTSLGDKIRDMDKQLTSNVNKINTSLEEKANKSDIGSPLIANTASDMIDTSKVYVYTGDEEGYTSGNWYSYNGTIWVSGGVYNALAIGKNSITPDKTNFFKVNPLNLYNYKTVTKGYIDGTTGEITKTETNYTTDFIEIDQNTYYYLNDIDGATINYAYFNENKDYISGYNNALYTSFTGTYAPTGAKYIRISFKISQCSIYDFKFSKEVISQNLYIDEDYVKRKDITLNDLKFMLSKSKNLFDKNDIVENVVIDNNNSGSEYGLTGYYASKYIEVVEGTTVLLNIDKCNYAFYNSLKEYIIGFNSVKLNAKVPTGAKYIRFSFNYTDYNINNVMLEVNSSGVSSDYEEYKYIIKNELLPSSTNHSKWKGKKWCSYGDSITQMNMWQDFVTEYFGFAKHYNRGIGGTTIKEIGSTAFINADGSLNATDVGQPQPNGTTRIKSSFCNSERINSMIPTDADLIVIMGGTNDMGRAITSDNPQPTPIGDTVYDKSKNDFNTDTFKGALASTIIKVKKRCPNAEILVASPVGGRGTTAGENMTSQVTNKLGLTTQDYAKAVKEVCEEFSIIYVPVFEESGINQFNRATYISDTVHPNITGGKRMSKVFIRSIEKIEEI